MQSQIMAGQSLSWDACSGWYAVVGAYRLRRLSHVSSVAPSALGRSPELVGLLMIQVKHLHTEIKFEPKASETSLSKQFVGAMCFELKSDTRMEVLAKPSDIMFRRSRWGFGKNATTLNAAIAIAKR